MATTTNNMNLQIPAPGDTDYPTSVSNSFTNIDAHDHTSSKGVPIPTAGLADGSVTTAKLAASALANSSAGRLKMADGFLSADAEGRAKVADGFITPAKVAALGHQLSTSSGVFQTTSTTAVDVTNLTVTITTTGRPIRLELQPDAATGGAVTILANAALAGAEVYFLDGATLIATFPLSVAATGSTAVAQTAQPSAFSFFYVAAAGTRTFKVQAATPAGGTIRFNDVKLLAYEIL